MDDPRDVVLGEDLVQQLDVVDIAVVERHVAVDEVAVPAGQVVDDHRGQALLAECPYHVRSDVSGAPGDQPSHVCLPSPSEPRDSLTADPRVDPGLSVGAVRI